MLKEVERSTRKTKAAPNVHIERQIITPEIAKAYLDQNKRNRKPAEKAVAKIARDMLNGDWRLTGDMIRFDCHNNLIDGQHRLLACIKADAPFETFVGYNFAPEDQDVIDTMRPRTTADMLEMHKVNSAKQVAALARLIIGSKADVIQSSINPSHTEILRIVQARPGLIKSVGMAHRAPPGIKKSALGFVHYCASQSAHARFADAFAIVFVTGVPTYIGDPAHALRERLIRIRDGDSVFPISSQSQVIKAMTHAFNLFVKSEAIERFQMPKRAKVDMEGLDLKAL